MLLRWGQGALMLGAIGALVRVRSCLAGAIVCFAGVRIGGGGSTPDEIAACLSTAFAIAFAQVDNDIVDRFLDQRDKPDRPLPSGQVPVSAARWLALGCTLASVLLALTVSAELAAFSLLVLTLSGVYSRYCKGTVLLGNAVVALLASATLPYGALAIGGEFSPFLISLQAMVFSIVLAHEVVKTIRDVVGDGAGGLVTVATKFGVRRAAAVAAVLCGVSAVATFVPLLYAPTPVAYVLAASLGIALPSLLAAWELATNVRGVADIAYPFRLLRFVWGAMVVVLLLL